VTSDITDLIDSALHDYDVSGDAMRSRPAPEPRTTGTRLWIVPAGTEPDADGWQPLGHVGEVEIEYEGDEEPDFPADFATPTNIVIVIDAASVTAAAERIRQLQAAFQAYVEAVRPRMEEAGRALAQGFEALRQAGLVDHDCKPARPRDRPAWQSPYGPPRRRR
jgi:hypothetical protein